MIEVAVSPKPRTGQKANRYEEDECGRCKKVVY